MRQALRLFEDYYVHLVLKRSIHGVDPVQRLKVLLRRRWTRSRDTQAFHEEMLSIFTSVRDLHTATSCPLHFHQRAAVLPFSVEEYFDDGRRAHRRVDGRGRLGSASPLTRSGAPLERGVVIDNVERAARCSARSRVNAERQGGCNPAARHARGLSTMTDRPLSLSPGPAGDVDPARVHRRGRRHRHRHVPLARDPRSRRWTRPTRRASRALGVDALGEAVRRSRKTRLHPELIAQEPGAGAGGTAGRPDGGRARRSSRAEATTTRCSAGPSTIDGRAFGHLRIRTFGVARHRRVRGRGPPRSSARCRPTG